LAKWAAYQRRQVRRRALPPDKVEKLAQCGITFDPYNVAWERRYAELRAFFTAEGHSNVPSEDGTAALASWCNNQRTLRKKASLRADRISRLDELHFLWNRPDARWSERYVELADFQRLHGHANVPDSKRSRSKLSKWCGVQRQFRKRGKLSRERIAMLDALGFAWRLRKRRRVS
jgi:Helicase associated domain